MLVVVTKYVVEDFVSAIIEALEVRMLACFSVRIEFHHIALFVRNEFVCSNWLMIIMFLFL